MDHEGTARRLYELINAGDLDGLADAIADDFVEHEEVPGLAPTKTGALEQFRLMRVAFPDMRMEPEDVIASGDRVAVRATFRGTHQAEFMGLPATGKQVEVNLIDILRFGDDGLAYEHWGVMDSMAMMAQLGAMPDGPVG